MAIRLPLAIAMAFAASSCSPAAAPPTFVNQNVSTDTPTNQATEKRSARIQNLIQESARNATVIESRSLIANPLNADELNESLDYIKSCPDNRSYHLLHLVRKHHLNSYQQIPPADRAAILCSAMIHLEFLNDWGYLGLESFDGPSAVALLETGKHALKPLMPILDNEDSAPLFGSEEATISLNRQYRRKDFAYRYIMITFMMEPLFDFNPKRRDEEIEILKKEIVKRGNS